MAEGTLPSNLLPRALRARSRRRCHLTHTAESFAAAFNRARLHQGIDADLDLDPDLAWDSVSRATWQRTDLGSYVMIARTAFDGHCRFGNMVAFVVEPLNQSG
jgi:hypothetical protein